MSILPRAIADETQEVFSNLPEIRLLCYWKV